jgi:hypothetical protein
MAIGDAPGEAGDDVDVQALIEQIIAPGRRPGPEALRPIREHVTQALARPTVMPAPGEIHGVRIGRRMIHVGDLIDIRYAKYIQHAVLEDQWPAGTTFDEYLNSAADIVSSDDSGVFADDRATGWRVTFVDRSGIWEGLEGGPYLIVVYDCRENRLVTAFQPSRGLSYVDHNDQVVNGTWLSRPR